MKQRATMLLTDIFYSTFPDEQPNDTVVRIDNPENDKNKNID